MVVTGNILGFGFVVWEQSHVINSSILQRSQQCQPQWTKLNLMGRGGKTWCSTWENVSVTLPPVFLRCSGILRLFWLRVLIHKWVLKGVWDNTGLSGVWNSRLVSHFPVPDCSAVKCCFCLQVLLAVPVSWSTRVTRGVLLADLHSVMDSQISTLVCFEELSVGSHKYFVSPFFMHCQLGVHI